MRAGRMRKSEVILLDSRKENFSSGVTKNEPPCSTRLPTALANVSQRDLETRASSRAWRLVKDPYWRLNINESTLQHSFE